MRKLNWRLYTAPTRREAEWAASVMREAFLSLTFHVEAETIGARDPDRSNWEVYADGEIDEPNIPVLLYLSMVLPIAWEKFPGKDE